MVLHSVDGNRFAFDLPGQSTQISMQFGPMTEEKKPLTEWERFNKVMDGLLAVPYAEVKFFGRDLGL